jgi:hypothetical protein
MVLYVFNYISSIGYLVHILYIAVILNVYL